MSQSPEQEEIYYQLTYHHGVDEKRRVQIPAKWRPQNENSRFFVVAWKKGAEGSLLVMPELVMKGLVTSLKQMPFADPRAETLRRVLGSNSDSVVLDKSGRICLPESLAKGAGIEKEAVLVGMFDRFQIWSPERYEATKAVDEALSGEAYSLI